MDVYAVLTEFGTALDDKLVGFIDTIMPDVQAFTAVIMVVYVAVKVVTSLISGSAKLDYTVLLRPCLTLAALSMYSFLVLNLIIEPTNHITAIIEEALGVTSSNLSSMRDTMEFSQSSGGADGSGVLGVVSLHGALEFLHMIIFFLSSIAGGYVLFRQLIEKSLYLMLGPFAIALSLIIGNHQVLSKWYQGYFAVMLWLPILSIVQAIIILLPVETTELSATDIMFSVAIQVVMIFTVFKVPQYADILVAQGSGRGANLGQRFKSELDKFASSKMKGRGNTSKKEARAQARKQEREDKYGGGAAGESSYGGGSYGGSSYGGGSYGGGSSSTGGGGASSINGDRGGRPALTRQRAQRNFGGSNTTSSSAGSGSADRGGRPAYTRQGGERNIGGSSTASSSSASGSADRGGRPAYTRQGGERNIGGSSTGSSSSGSGSADRGGRAAYTRQDGQKKLLSDAGPVEESKGSRQIFSRQNAQKDLGEKS